MRKLFAAGVAAGVIGSLGCGSNPQAAAQAPAVPPPATTLPAPAADSTPKAFVGVWVPVSCQAKGAEQLGDPKMREAIRLSIENGQHKLYFLTDPEKLIGKRLAAAGLTVDEKAGTFTLEMTESPNHKKGEQFHGIFAFDGDTMKLCYGPAGQPRPTKFESPKGSDVFSEVWTRHKKK